MIVDLVLAAALLLQSDPRDRLADAIRETRPDAVQAALRDVLKLDPTRAARAVVAALPKSRDRIASLHLAVVGARKDFDRVATGFTLTKEEEELKDKALESARERLKEANRRAVDGELVYDALRGAFAKLPAGAGPALEKEVEETGSWLLKCEILEGLGAMGATEAVQAALAREEEPVVVAAALRAGGAGGARDRLASPHWQIRLSALRALGGSKDAVEPLIKALDSADGRFRLAAGESLVGLTKTRLPPDADVWRDWWKANRDDFLAGSYTPSSVRRLDRPGRTTFYEIPIASTRVCFVIDRSKSMKENGKFDTAKKELKGLLDELPDGARVNIVFFGESTSTFSQSTRVLDRTSRRDAAYFIDKSGYEEGTNILLALEKALSFVGSAETGKLREDGPDTIVLLSDGQSTVGRLVDDELIARVVARRSRPLMPVVHTVSIAAESKTMRMLAELCGGEYRSK
jgi:hypothetical protein